MVSGGPPKKRYDHPLTPFGDYLRIALTWKGIKAAALARELGLNPSTVTGYSTGAQPSRETVLRISEILQVTRRHRMLLLYAAGYCTDEQIEQVRVRLSFWQDTILGEGERIQTTLFGLVMKSALRYARMNEVALARESGVEAQAVTNAMSGENHPKRELVLAWCRVLEAPPTLTEHLCHALSYCTEDEKQIARDLLIWRDVTIIGPEALLPYLTTEGPPPRLSMPDGWEDTPQERPPEESGEG